MKPYDRTIGIIGGGASGIGVAKAFAEIGADYEILEATQRLGGNWQPNGPASKMYESVHLISSKRNTQFSDFPMPKYYPDYPSHSLMHAYLMSIVQHFGIDRQARLGASVVRVCHDENGWECHLENGEVRRYRVLVVCNGLLRKPIIPDFPGEFHGDSIHSANYKSAQQFRGRRALVVGGGNSGCDIAVDAALNATAAFHSTRRGYHYMPKFISGQPTQEWLMDQAPKFADSRAYWEHVQSTFKLAGFDGEDFGLPRPTHGIDQAHPILNSQVLYHIGHGDLVPKPNVERLCGTHVRFDDGTQEEIDLIVWATGFSTDLSFFADSGFDLDKEFDRLFLRILPQRYDDLLFVGYLNTPSGLGNLLNITARFVAAYTQAYLARSSAWQMLSQLKLNPDGVDLGQHRFMATARHRFEVDLWKYLRAVNFVSGKLKARNEPPPAQNPHQRILATT